MDSSLRPRDIQARLRAGESPQDVADAAGVPIERIAAFSDPVMAERDHVAEATFRYVAIDAEGRPRPVPDNPEFFTR